MELAEALRIGYRAAMSALVYNGNPVPVYGEGSIDENQPEPYVIISTFTGEQRFTDKGKVFECTQLVDIVTSSMEPIGFGQAYAIADQVEEAINPDSGANVDIRTLGYRIGNTFTLATTPIEDKVATKYIYRVLKRYRHLVSKESITT